MKKYVDGKYIDFTQEELVELEIEEARAEAEYWANVDTGEAVNDEIRKKYSESAEFAILRQKEEKPEEYAEYYAYCEQCKAYVKEQKEKYK
jgi:hypothetical protein